MADLREDKSKKGHANALRYAWVDKESDYLRTVNGICI
jgi:hypothetical protein